MEKRKRIPEENFGEIHIAVAARPLDACSARNSTLYTMHSTLYTGLICPNPAYVHTPLIEIQSVQDDSPLKQAAARIEHFDYLLFTSRFTVKYFLPYLTTELKLIKQLKVVSIGSTTTAALKEAGIEDIQQVEQDNSYGVVDWFDKQQRGKVLIPRSNLALGIIPEGLQKSGFEVTAVTAYENRMPEHPKRINLDEIDEIIFTSPSTIDNFIHLYGAMPTDKKLTTRGPITENHLKTIIKEQSL